MHRFVLLSVLKRCLQFGRKVLVLYLAVSLVS